MPAHLIDLTGKRFGLLTVVRLASRRGGKTRWVCICDCASGREVEVQAQVLTRVRAAKSCGCLKRDNAGTFVRKPDGEIGYFAAHDRVRTTRGSASGHSCANCGGPAKDWALRKDAARRIDPPGGYPFSPDPDDYQPMCRSCHNSYDRQREQSG